MRNETEIRTLSDKLKEAFDQNRLTDHGVDFGDALLWVLEEIPKPDLQILIKDYIEQIESTRLRKDTDWRNKWK